MNLFNLVRQVFEEAEAHCATCTCPSQPARLRSMGIDMSGRSANRFRDEPGTEPGSKDIARLQDIKVKAGGNTDKIAMLVRVMAGAIKDRDKAMRRAKAAMQVFPGDAGKIMAQMFMAKFGGMR